MEEVTGEEALGQRLCPQCQAGGGAFLLEHWGLAGSCDVPMRVCDKIPRLAAAGWQREPGVGAAEQSGVGLPERLASSGVAATPRILQTRNQSQARALGECWTVPGGLTPKAWPAPLPLAACPSWAWSDPGPLAACLSSQRLCPHPISSQSIW